MRFSYCPHCGTKLTTRPAGDDGDVPYCKQCKKLLFDMFSTCIIALVVRDDNKVALLEQNYMSTEYKVLVSGYMQPGESAEECAAREIKEELGLDIYDLRLKKTIWFEKKDMLMVAFIARTHNDNFVLSGEVDSAGWYDPSQALSLVHPKRPGNASYYLVETFLKELASEN